MLKITAILATAGVLALTADAALADGDAKAGAKIFKKCAVCHMIGAGAKNKIGPALTGVVGSPAGRAENYKYSAAMKKKAKAGLVWDEASLNTFLTKPRKFVPKTKMSFPGLKKKKDRKNVIAYLKSVQ